MANAINMPFGETSAEIIPFRAMRPNCVTDELIDCIANQIASNLWPLYDPQSQSWPNPYRLPFSDLATADIEMMASLSGNLKNSPCVCNLPPHQTLFAHEDLSNAEVINSLERYVYKKSDEVNRTPLGIFAKSELGNCVGLPIELKLRFQRMRPFQAAFLLNTANFSYLGARSAYSPSLPSGHCFQGAYVACRIYEAHLADARRLSLTAIQLENLKHFAVDVGDRRVFAGVHYPSDNIASWFAMASIIPHCFSEHEKLLAFLGECLAKSLVKNDLDKNAVMKLPMKWLMDAIRTPPCGPPVSKT